MSVERVEQLVRESVARMEAMFAPVPPGFEAAPPESIRDLIDRLLENLANVDADEAAAILAKIEEAVAAYTAGRWIVGTIAVAAAFRLYRQAIQD